MQYLTNQLFEMPAVLTLLIIRKLCHKNKIRKIKWNQKQTFRPSYFKKQPTPALTGH